jgi:hypothetical protein
MEYSAAVQSVLDMALTGVETANFEFPLITKGGARIEVLLNATTRRDEQGNIIGVVGIGQDITARLAQEREYSKLIDTANAVCLMSQERLYQSKLCGILGLTYPFFRFVSTANLWGGHTRACECLESVCHAACGLLEGRGDGKQSGS